MSKFTNAKVLKPRDHYAAHGPNSSIVLETKYDDPIPSDGNAKKITTIAFRKGREDENEAVQIELEITTHGKRAIGKHASVSFDQATWNAIVEFVKENREIAR